MKWIVAVLLCGCLTGCAGQDYLMESAQAKTEIADQLAVIVGEYHGATMADLDAAEDATFNALKASIKLTPKEADAKIDKARTILDTITEKRAQESERAILSARLLAFLRKLAAQDAAITLRQTNDIDQLRDLAEKAMQGGGK